jgi:hypothetical protein
MFRAIPFMKSMRDYLYAGLAGSGRQPSTPTPAASGEFRHPEFAMGSGEMSTGEFTGFLWKAMTMSRHKSQPGRSPITVQALCERKVVSLLTANLREELAAAKKITKIGLPLIRKSAGEPEAEPKPKTGKEKYSARRAKKMSKRPRATFSPRLGLHTLRLEFSRKKMQ